MNPLTKRISSKLKQLRKQRGWSLDKTSLHTGVSKAMLGQIERQESSPTISTLWKIASGFDVSFSLFIDKSQPIEDPIISRESFLNQINDSDDKFIVTPIFPFESDLNFEAYTIELSPGCIQLSSAHQKGVIEHIIITSGELEILIQDEWILLKEKEGIRFDADQPHGYRNLSDVTAVMQNMIHYT